MFCSKCGSKVEDGQKFCPNCGNTMNAAPEAKNSQGCNGTVTYKNVKDNPNMTLLASAGCFSVFEHQQDMSTEASEAQTRYFMHKMNIRKRQVLADLTGNAIKMQAGAMQ